MLLKNLDFTYLIDKLNKEIAVLVADDSVVARKIERASPYLS